MIRRLMYWAIAMSMAAGFLHAAPRGDGELTIEVVDADTHQPIAARMYLKNARGRPVRLRLPNTAEFGGHFYIDGQLRLPLRVGQYTFEIDAGPEFRTQSGHFEIERHAGDSKRIEMKRFANLADEGWYGGDLDFTRAEKDLPLILRAEGLNDIEHPDGILLLELAASAQALSAKPERTVRVARAPFAWNLPIWLAQDAVDAIQLIHHHALRDGVLDNEGDGRPRDRSLFPGATGNGRWSETIYYHVLNCGLRIPPAAGSGSGTNENPVGANRVYVYCGEEFSNQRWWEGLEAGRVFVTNGPLLRPTVQGNPPGYVFRIGEGERISLDVGLNLATRVPVEYLQIVKNGEVATEVRLAEWVNRKGQLPPVEFNDSGWFLVRAVTTNRRTYQFASSGPYYVEQSGRPRVSRRSVQFFLDWIDEAELRARELPKLSESDRERMLAEQQMARRFFEGLLAEAIAD